MPVPQFLIFSVCLAFANIGFAAAFEWPKVSPEELAMTEPLVDSEAGAEALYREFVVTQTTVGYSMDTEIVGYDRIKVYDSKGLDTIARQKIFYRKGEKIISIRGRTIRPDGTISVLEDSMIFDDVSKEAGKETRRVKSFAFPGLEVGSIVELQYTLKKYSGGYFLPIEFSGPFPTHKIRYELKPPQSHPGNLKMLTFEVPDKYFEEDKQGNLIFELENLPASVEEEFSTPKLQREPHVIVYFTRDGERELRSYWKDESKRLYVKAKDELHPAGLVKRKVGELLEGVENDDEKLRRIYEFCSKRIKNQSYSFDLYSDSELDELPENKHPTHTLKRGSGTAWDIVCLFGAMARAAGFDARLAELPNNERMVFEKWMKVFFAHTDSVVAIQRDGVLTYYDPSRPYLPFGVTVPWSCRSYAIVGEEKRGELQPTPELSPDQAVYTREWNLSIDEDGTLTGDATLRYTGYAGLQLRREFLEKIAPEQRRHLKNEYEERMPGSSISDIRIRNVDECEKPVVVKFEIEMPGFAEVVQSRMIFQPALFQRNAKALFIKDNRETDILLPFMWTELDFVQIELPEGFAVESRSSPLPVVQPGGANCEYQLGFSKTKNALIYRRIFRIENSSYPLEVYPGLKEAFRVLDQSDDYAVFLKRKEQE